MDTDLDRDPREGFGAIAWAAGCLFVGLIGIAHVVGLL
jgi:hypothetical protein